jgi:Na+-driven multidrug efflux pump
MLLTGGGNILSQICGEKEEEEEEKTLGNSAYSSTILYIVTS